MTWLWFLVAAVAIAIILVATSRLPRVRRWRCAVCGTSYATEADLTGHVSGLHGRCTSRHHGHRCVDPVDHPGPHRCGCELLWTR
jgi:hypothetical protein